MKKTFVLVLFCLAFSGSVFSQDENGFRFGLRAGAGYSVLSDLDQGHEPIIAPLGAVSAEYMFSDGFSLGLEIFYHQHGYKNDNGSKLNAHYLGFPLLAKRYFPSGIFSLVGFEVAGLAASENLSFSNVPGMPVPPPFVDLKDVAISIPVGFGYQVAKGLTVEARWNIGLSKISNNYEYKPNLYSLSLGYYIN